MFSASFSTVIPPTCSPPSLFHFNEVSENKILKIIKNSPTKLGLLDSVPTFLLKDCVDIGPTWTFTWPKRRSGDLHKIL